MPHRHNGTGTCYYGKRRIHSQMGTCEFCKRYTNLESYDTTLFFVMLLIPIIPLGKKRILQECSACSKHRVLSYSKWNDAKARDSATVLAKLQSDPNDRDALLQALGFAISYQDEPLFDSLVERLGVEGATDALIQAQLGDGYYYFGRWPETEKAYRTSLKLQDNETVREGLGWALLKQDRPDEAKPYLQHILTNKKVDSVGSIYYLIEGYQAQGRHEEALELMDECEQAFPKVMKTQDYQRQRKASKRYLGTNKKIPSTVLSAGRSGYREGNWTAWVPYLIVWSIPFILLSLYLGAAMWIGQSRSVWFVNGTSKPYSIVVEGKEYNLAPFGGQRVRVHEGEVNVSFSDPKLGLEPVAARIETNFWGRPFDGHMFIINPDRSAIILEEERFYAEVNPPPAGPPQVHFGQDFYRLWGIDYSFADFPPYIEGSKNGGQERKTRVTISQGFTPEYRLGWMQSLDKTEQIKFCKNLLQLEPENGLFLNWLIYRMAPQEAIAFLEPRLEERPILVEWHRIYQSQMERTHPETDLLPRYRKLLDDNKGNPDAIYLLGRVQPDLDEGEKLYLQAATANPPSAFALAGLGFRALSAGRLDDAKHYYEKAVSLATDKVTIERMYRETLMARKDYSILLEAVQKDSDVPGRKRTVNVELIRLYAIGGDKATAEKMLKEMEITGSPQDQQATRQALEAMIFICLKDVKSYLKAKENSPTFETAFLRGDLKQAESLIRPNEHNSIVYHGLLFVEAWRSGQKELAGTHWSALLADLKKDGREERQFAELLVSRKPFEIGPPQRMPIEPHKKRILLAVLAQRYPDKAKELFALAQQLDYQHDAISMCLSKYYR
jgi:tetratricopeptide (TPR) repeat protein